MEPVNPLGRPPAWRGCLNQPDGLRITRALHRGTIQTPKTHHSGHGGNVALKSREPSDYQISILQIAGTDATTDEIIGMEERWKKKLQSKEMGLNR